MFEDGELSATACVYVMRNARKIMNRNHHGYEVNDYKAKWVDVGENLWKDLSTRDASNDACRGVLW